jgi:hypothetical protein
VNFKARYAKNPVKSSPEMQQYHRLKAQAYYLRGANDFFLHLMRACVLVPGAFVGPVSKWLNDQIAQFIAKNRPDPTAILDP